MDIKTLEHYEQRAKKGREMVNKMKQLMETIVRVKSSSGVVFTGSYTSCDTILKSSNSNHRDIIPQPRALERVVKATEIAIREEIETLEQELAEL